jgi:hypothetical protein
MSVRRLFLALILLAACAPQGQPSPAPAPALRLPTARDLLAPDASAQQLLVAPELAERWARGFARESYALPQATVCLRLPRRDAAGALISYQHILSARADCGGLDRLLALAAAAWPAGRADLEAALRASGARLVTVEVAAFSYRHPLEEAFRGLPPWLLHLGRRWPDELPRSCVPSALLPEDPDRTQVEVVSYQCGETRLVYDHHLSRLLPPSALMVRHDAAAGLRRFQSVLRARYGERVAARLDEHRSLWTRHLEGGAR